MLIGIIGAGIAGLTAGKLLANQGHEVIVLEKSRGFGGRLATRYTGQENKERIDHGTGYLSAKSDTFKTFISELQSKGILSYWDNSLSLCNTDGFYETHPSKEVSDMFVAPEGMNTIGRYLGRTLDVKLNSQVSGITVVSKGGFKKRPWIINFLDTSVLELDALIIATPSIQALGLLHTAQDETVIRYMNSVVAKVEYESTIAVMAGFGKRDIPSWKGVICQNDVIKWVSNENSKRAFNELTLVAHTTHDFAKAHKNASDEVVINTVLSEVATFAGPWAKNPEWSLRHFWLYNRCVQPLSMPYLESGDTDAPLALIGDYFNGTDAESAYLSGLALAEHWLNKFPNP
jgi:renalase